MASKSGGSLDLYNILFNNLLSINTKKHTHALQILRMRCAFLLLRFWAWCFCVLDWKDSMICASTSVRFSVIFSAGFWNKFLVYENASYVSNYILFIWCKEYLNTWSISCVRWFEAIDICVFLMAIWYYLKSLIPRCKFYIQNNKFFISSCIIYTCFAEIQRNF